MVLGLSNFAKSVTVQTNGSGLTTKEVLEKVDEIRVRHCTIRRKRTMIFCCDTGEYKNKQSWYMVYTTIVNDGQNTYALSMYVCEKCLTGVVKIFKTNQRWINHYERLQKE